MKIGRLSIQPGGTLEAENIEIEPSELEEVEKVLHAAEALALATAKRST